MTIANKDAIAENDRHRNTTGKDIAMKTDGDKLEAFKVTGDKPGLTHNEENGV